MLHQERIIHRALAGLLPGHTTERRILHDSSSLSLDLLPTLWMNWDSAEAPKLGGSLTTCPGRTERASLFNAEGMRRLTAIASV